MTTFGGSESTRPNVKQNNSRTMTTGSSEKASRSQGKKHMIQIRKKGRPMMEKESEPLLL
jgi:hypothetical protein